MSIGGIIFIACVITAFTVFSIVLAWGVRQTNLAEREKAAANVATFNRNVAAQVTPQQRAA